MVRKLLGEERRAQIGALTSGSLLLESPVIGCVSAAATGRRYVYSMSVLVAAIIPSEAS